MMRLRADDLVGLATLSDHDVNPRTGDLLLTSAASGLPSLLWLPATGGTPIPVLEGRGQHPSWSHDGASALFLSDSRGREQDDLFRLWPVERRVDRLTDDDFAYTWPRTAPDGTLSFISNRDGNFDPYLWEPPAPPRRLATSDHAASSLVWSLDGQWLAFLRLTEADVHGNSQTALHLYDRHADSSRQLALLGGDLFHAELCWLPDGSLCVPCDGNQFQGLLRITRDGAREWLVNEAGDADSPRVSPDGQWLSFILSDGLNEDLWIQHLEIGERHRLGVGAGLHYQPRWAPDSQSLTLFFAGPTRPPDVWRVPLDGPPAPLTHSVPAAFPREDLTDAEAIHYPSDGFTIPALLYRPALANGAALVVAHGGPTSRHRNGWDTTIQYLCHLGFTVLAPNVRGSTGYGKQFRDLCRFDWGGADLDDIGAANHYMRTLGYERIGILGNSYGGYLVLMALTMQPALWDAGAALYGIANLRTLYASSRPSDILPYLIDQIGTPDDRAAFYDERSPLNHVEQMCAPLLLLHGALDIRTTVHEAEQIARRLTALGHAPTLHIYPDEGHGFQRLATRIDALERVATFFQEQLSAERKA